MPDVIYITGAKGGSGATTCAVKAGLALAERGERTLYVDGDALSASGMQT
ncbi:MAG: AAA family ATPase, partial [Candidatus Coproplasma sp.]